MKDNINDWANKKLIRFWDRFEDKVEEVPSFYPELKKNKILFVGLNPSCAQKEKRVGKIFGKNLEILNQESKNELISDFFRWEKDIDQNVKKIDDIIEERLIPRGGTRENPYRYFRPFYRLSKKVEGDEREWTCIEVNGEKDYVERKWEHIDVFRTIAENKKKLKKRLDLDFEDEECLASKQFCIFNSLLVMLEPEIIIVQSALAADIIKNKLNISDISWEEEGFHVIELNNKKVPILFTGMLSVGYDKGSRKRLIWHVKKAKEWVKKASIDEG